MQDEFDVGARLRRLRGEAGLSQRQLAEAAGVPHGQISMIETNRCSPSVSSLLRIIGGLGVTMSAFFEPDSADRAQVFFAADELTDLTGAMGGTDTPVLKQVGESARHALQILHETYQPGDDTGETMLEHEASEGGIVIEGEIEVTVGDEVRVLRSGDAYLFDSTRPHRFRNTGDTPAVIVSACTPPYL